ncbi:MAG TPA: maltose alpha-D-glucosyltransferase [Acidimicrobiales bacterium]|nr:maltose alpha-D-glucosyltransferase [Acidimicrobiales bacterium]
MSPAQPAVSTLVDDPEWYRDGVIYQLHVRSFADSNGDGIGDFRGLTSRLDYLAELGVTALWLMPFYPSPLRDDGYDIADYEGVNPSYGTLRDFRTFLDAAHRRGMRVITEMVMNHTSDQHEWFQRSRRAAPGTKWRDFYVWSDTPDRYRDARIIFQDFESSNWTWDPVAGAYFWHRFYSHQPDLNFESPHVRAAIFKVLDRWFEMGVDGVRLDAVPYLFEREGTSCENLPETHQFLKDLRAHVDAKFRNRMFLAEANQWPEDAAAYFGDGDECHMNYHFPVMPRLYMAARMEDRLPIVDILEQTPELPAGAQWAMFLRNHDELTLEMVTDEERDYMVRAYANDPEMRINLGIRRRLAPLLQNDRRKIELLNALLFSLPGTPVVYYGDEIAMGDNVYLGDRDAVRTPMQWSPDRNAGFSKANPQRLYLPPIIDPGYHYETVNVEAAQQNPSSLLRWTQRLISLRKRNKVFGRGDITFLDPDNNKVLAFIRSLTDDDGSTSRVLVVANLSRHAQAVELDLRDHAGSRPVEMFGQSRFAPIGELPYYLTLGPYQFFWFTLESMVPEGEEADDGHPPLLRVRNDWHDLLSGAGRSALMRALPSFLMARRWFAGKDRDLRGVKVTDVVPLAVGRRKPRAYLMIIEVDYVGADSEHYLLPVAAATGERAAELLTYRRDAVIARIEKDDAEIGVLIDAVADADVVTETLVTMANGRTHAGATGRVVGEGTRDLRRLLRGAELVPKLLGAEQSNTSVAFGDEVMLKLIRKLDVGINPDLEMGRALTAEGFAHSPALLGGVQYEGKAGPMTLAMAHRFTANEGDTWRHTLDVLARFYDDVAHLDGGASDLPAPPDPLTVDAIDVPDEIATLIGTYLDTAGLLAQRTAEMHMSLAGVPDEAFTPVGFTGLYQRSLYQSFRGQVRSTLAMIRRGRDQLDPAAAELAHRLLDREAELMDRIALVRSGRIEASRIRIHGDYHLGQVLWTGRDVVIIDFEGEPSRPIGERRIKRSPLVDVAGMLRSFHYAARAALLEQQARGAIGDEADGLERYAAWGELWRRWVEAVYLHRYLDIARPAGIVPDDPDELRLLIDSYTLEKALYEARYELRYRPDWATIPLGSILELLGEVPGR